MLNLEGFINRKVSIMFHSVDRLANGVLMREKVTGNYFLNYHDRSKDNNVDLYFEPDYIISIREHPNQDDT